MSTLGYHILRLCSWKHAPKEKHAPALKRLCFETKDRFLKKGFQFAALQCGRYIYIYNKYPSEYPATWLAMNLHRNSWFKSQSHP